MRCVIATTVLLATVLFLKLATPAGGQEQPAAAAAEVQTIQLAVAPAAEPRPALRYRLTPAPFERTPGNAAIFYYRAMLALKSLPAEHWKDFDLKSGAWLALPLDKLPKDEVRQWIGSGPLHGELQKAAYREHCDWDLRVQDLRGLDTIYLLLDDAQQCRSLARKLQLKARLETSEGRYADALETLRHGYQLGHDVAQTPLLINGLIGIAITAVMNGELAKLIEVSDANYYWALAALPSPVIDMRPAMEYEMNIPNQIFPFLKDAETAERSPEEWQRLIADCLRTLPELGSGSSGHEPQWQSQLLAAAIMAKLYPAAKERLIAGGMPAGRVEAMPVGQVVAIHTARAQRYLYDEVGKLFYLPASEAIRRDAQVIEHLRSQGFLLPGIRGEEGLPIASLMLPAVSNVKLASIRLDRERAALMTIEALRMHAAATGKLPAALAEVTVVPVPPNPMTGQPFAYQLDAASGAATLDLPAPAGFGSPQGNARRYVIHLRK
jgi:hypothetical protein